MRGSRGLQAISLLALIGGLWGLLHLSHTGTTPVATELAPTDGARPRALPRLDRSRAAVLEDVLGMSVVPNEPLGILSHKDGGRPFAGFALPTGWAPVASFARGRPVAEPSLWLVLGVASAAVLARRRAV